MAQGTMLDKLVGRAVVVHTGLEHIPQFGFLTGYDDLGVMLHIPAKLAEMLGTGGAPAAESLIFIPWRVVEYVASDTSVPEEAAVEEPS